MVVYVKTCERLRADSLSLIAIYQPAGYAVTGPDWLQITRENLWVNLVVNPDISNCFLQSTGGG